MALVKKSELAGKVIRRDPVTPVKSIQEPIKAAPISTRREQNRSRARQEKAAERIGAATEELAAGLTEAASQAAELSGSLQEIASSAEEAASAAQQSQAAVDSLGPIFVQARDRAETSRAKTASLQAFLLEVGAQIEVLATSVADNAARQLASVDLVAKLEAQATSVGEITTTVGDIADQTNLLALNAAIEAARAGDHGRGFAVVADEVRAFSETSEKSARQVQDLAQAVVNDVRTVSARIKKAAEVAHSEAQNGKAVATSLEAIRADIRVLAEGSESILLAMTEAESGAREVRKGAEQIASAAEEQAGATNEAQQAVQQQSTSLEQAQKTAQSLAGIAEGLQSDDGSSTSAQEVASAAEELSATVQELSGAATEILAAVEQIGKAAQIQSAATQQSNAAMTQIEKAAESTREAASHSVQTADALLPNLETNRNAVRSLTNNVVESLKETQAVGSLINSLEASARRIDKIVDSIAVVAVQTNMLAVTGSVEAARAGEFGRGFALVSSDIRKLARDSSDNADTVKDVARLIQDQIVSVKRDLEQIAVATQGELRRNQKIQDDLAVIETDMRTARSSLADILKGSDAIVTSVRQVMEGTQQVAAAAEQANRAAQQATTAATEQARGADDLAAAIEEIASLADELHIAKS
jgi:methyl-accepting chemotaxis protein